MHTGSIFVDQTINLMHRLVSFVMFPIIEVKSERTLNNPVCFMCFHVSVLSPYLIRYRPPLPTAEATTVILE
jgi:hypothetical protein